MIPERPAPCRRRGAGTDFPTRSCPNIESSGLAARPVLANEFSHGDHAFSIRCSKSPALGAADTVTGVGHRAARALFPGIFGLRGLSGRLWAVARAPAGELRRAVQ